MKRQYIVSILFGILALAHVSGQASDSLMAAYQKEFVFLDTEIRLLKERIKEVELDGDERIASSRRELRNLEAKLLQLGAKVERKQEELRLVEDERNSAEDATDTILSIISQSDTRLESFGRMRYLQTLPDNGASMSDSEKLQNELAYGFTQSFEILESLGTIRKEKGNFFLPNGKEVDGTLIHIGRIASFGTNADHGGTLAPAGGGLFHLIKSNKKTADQLSEGSVPVELPLFLYESLDTLVDTANEKTLTDTIEGGGFIGIIIIFLGFAAAVLLVLRAYTLRSTGTGTRTNIDAIAEEVEARNWDEAGRLAEGIPGALGRVLAATLEGLKIKPKRIDDTIAESVLNEQPPLERYRIALSVFAAVAPLLGLLGTVTGMIATFDIITIYGTGDPKLLSGGISEALITTQMGLMVAIPTLLIGNLLSSWAGSITSMLEVKALRLVNVFTGKKDAGE